MFRFYSENVKVFNGNWEIYYYQEWTHMVSFVGDKTIIAISCPAISAWVKLIRGKKKFEFVYRCMHLGKWIFTRKKKVVNYGTNLLDSDLWQNKFAGRIFAILWTIRKNKYVRIRYIKIRTSSMTLKTDLNVRYQNSDWPEVNRYTSKPLSHV